MSIEKRSTGQYAILRARSGIERYADVAKYSTLLVLARMTRNAELVTKRKRQLLLPLVVKNRPVYWLDTDENTSHTEIEPHAMPYYVVKRLLTSIPRQEIEGKMVLDLFSGHGAIGFSLATGGLEGDITPKSIVMLDNAYSRFGKGDHQILSPNYQNAGYWKLNYMSLSALARTHWDDGRPGGWIFKREPDYCAGDGSLLPINNRSIDTVLADPPFGELTKAADPEELMIKSLHEVKRVLKPRGNAYYLMPWAWTDHVTKNAPMKGTLLARNIGRTWFDISLIKFTNGE